MLRITVEGGDPERPVRVLAVQLTGLPEATLRRLEAVGLIGALGLPRQALGVVRGGVGPDRTRVEGNIFITKDEVGVPRNITNSRGGQEWLRQHGAREDACRTSRTPARVAHGRTSTATNCPRTS